MKRKYIVTLSIETDEKLLKKWIKAFLLDVISIAKPGAKIRVHRIDME